MSIRKAALVCRAQIAALSAVGVFWGSFAAMVPSLKAGIGAGDGPMGAALMMSAVGAMISIFAAPAFVRPAGRWLLPAGGIALALAAAGPSLAGSVLWFGAAMFGIGLTMSFYDMCTNMRIAVLERRHGLHLQNLNHAMFSLSFGVSAFVTTLARSAGATPVDVLPWLVAAIAILAALSDEGRGWAPGPDMPQGGGERMPWMVVAIVSAILFAAFLSENANEGWSALHIERTLGAPAGHGGFGPAMLGLTMAVGRLSGQVATARIGDLRLIFWAGVASVAGLVILALAPAPAVGIAGVALFGFGISVIVPTGNAVLARLVPRGLEGLAISRAWVVGFAGFFVGPAAIGAISEAAGLRTAFLCVAGLVAAIPVLAVVLRRRGG
ncbi:MAG: MFS transporter [Paracoccaceae bacterium]